MDAAIHHGESRVPKSGLLSIDEETQMLVLYGKKEEFQPIKRTLDISTRSLISLLTFLFTWTIYIGLIECICFI